MEQVGAHHARHRVPASHLPEDQYRSAAIGLVVTFGLTMGVSQDAWQSDRHGWAIFFLIMDVVNVALYFWTVNSYLSCINLTGD